MKKVLLALLSLCGLHGLNAAKVEGPIGHAEGKGVEGIEHDLYDHNLDGERGSKDIDGLPENSDSAIHSDAPHEAPGKGANDPIIDSGERGLDESSYDNVGPDHELRPDAGDTRQNPSDQEPTYDRATDESRNNSATDTRESGARDDAPLSKEEFEKTKLFVDRVIEAFDKRMQSLGDQKMADKEINNWLKQLNEKEATLKLYEEDAANAKDRAKVTRVLTEIKTRKVKLLTPEVGKYLDRTMLAQGRFEYGKSRMGLVDAYKRFSSEMGTIARDVQQEFPAYKLMRTQTAKEAANNRRNWVNGMIHDTAEQVILDIVARSENQISALPDSNYLEDLNALKSSVFEVLDLNEGALNDFKRAEKEKFEKYLNSRKITIEEAEQKLRTIDPKDTNTRAAVLERVRVELGVDALLEVRNAVDNADQGDSGAESSDAETDFGSDTSDQEDEQPGDDQTDSAIEARVQAVEEQVSTGKESVVKKWNEYIQDPAAFKAKLQTLETEINALLAEELSQADRDYLQELKEYVESAIKSVDEELAGDADDRNAGPIINFPGPPESDTDDLADVQEKEAEAEKDLARVEQEEQSITDPRVLAELKEEEATYRARIELLKKEAERLEAENEAKRNAQGQDNTDAQSGTIPTPPPPPPVAKGAAPPPPPPPPVVGGGSKTLAEQIEANKLKSGSSGTSGKKPERDPRADLMDAIKRGGTKLRKTGSNTEPSGAKGSTDSQGGIAGEIKGGAAGRLKKTTRPGEKPVGKSVSDRITELNDMNINALDEKQLKDVEAKIAQIEKEGVPPEKEFIVNGLKRKIVKRKASLEKVAKESSGSDEPDMNSVMMDRIKKEREKDKAGSANKGNTKKGDDDFDETEWDDDPESSDDEDDKPKPPNKKTPPPTKPKPKPKPKK